MNIFTYAARLAFVILVVFYARVAMSETIYIGHFGCMDRDTAMLFVQVSVEKSCKSIGYEDSQINWSESYYVNCPDGGIEFMASYRCTEKKGSDNGKD